MTMFLEKPALYSDSPISLDGYNNDCLCLVMSHLGLCLAMSHHGLCLPMSHHGHCLAMSHHGHCLPMSHHGHCLAMSHQGVCPVLSHLYTNVQCHVRFLSHWSILISQSDFDTCFFAYQGLL